MRSDQIHRALAKGSNRFEVCQLVAKGVRATHKTGDRFEDSINSVLHCLGTGTTRAWGTKSTESGQEAVLPNAA